MTYTHIAYEVADHVATITLDRPEALNAFTDTMYRELLDAFDRIDADDEVRAVVITGRGRGFCAGADLGDGGATFDISAAGEAPKAEDHRDTGGVLCLRIAASLKPVIAAVNGPAVGIGATMTLVADIRVASEAAKLGFPFTRRGIVPDGCASYFLPRIVGIGRAQEWVLTGRVFPATEALAAGLVRSLHAPDDVLPEAYALAREIADNAAPVSVALARQLLWRGLWADHPTEVHLLESKLLFERGRADDSREGVVSFLEKRPPRFPNTVSTDLAAIYPW